MKNILYLNETKDPNDDNDVDDASMSNNKGYIAFFVPRYQVCIYGALSSNQEDPSCALLDTWNLTYPADFRQQAEIFYG